MSSSIENIQILYEDDDVLVINKPSGLVVHEDGRKHEETVVDWFLTRVPEAFHVGEPKIGREGTPLERSGVVHRLDRETSGVLLLVKHQDAFMCLKEQFKNRTIQKEYRAFVYGTMKDRWGTISKPIGRSVAHPSRRSAEKGARGLLRDAVTDWECIGQSSTHAYLRLLPKTGRTHQLRVHLRAIGRPIVHDTLYAPESLRGVGDLGFTRLALHAYSLVFTLPNGEEKNIRAPIPPDFEAGETALATALSLC